MILPILQIGDEHLTKKCKKIANVTDLKIKKLIRDMIDTCKADEKGTAGLAAPQVGENVRLTVIRRVDLEERNRKKGSDVEKNSDNSSKSDSASKPAKVVWEALVNPEIVELDREHESLIWEACLSIGVGEKQLWGPVWRPDYVKIRYQTPADETKELAATGFFAHLIQHELDHLDGILFTKYVANPERNLWKSSDLDAYLEKTGEYPEEV